MSQPVPIRQDARDDCAPDTKNRLLDAAERVFAERGYDGASMRSITQTAGSSVSAANYHFGGKEALWSAVLRRRLAPMNEARLAALAGLGPRPAPAEVFEAYFRAPIERRSRVGTASHSSFQRHVMARLYTEAPERAHALKVELFGEVSARFHEALARAFPAAGEATLLHIEQLAVAALVHVLSGELGAAGKDDGTLLSVLVAHASAGAAALTDLQGGR